VIYAMDTDHLSFFQTDSIEGFNIGRRLTLISPADVHVTIITYEEQMRGWLTYVARANTPARQIDAYRKLRLHVERFRKIPLLDYDEKAVAEFERLKRLRIRIGTMDLKIAAIAIANDATVLTRNAQHFRQVPDLRIEDWTL
jgi:tRNA(fMet)-specific endonuclease VapC